MKIKIASLQMGLNQWHEDLEPSLLELDVNTYSSLVGVDIEAVRSLGRIEVKVVSESTGHFLCDRCGEPFEMRVGGEYTVIFVERDRPFPDEMPGDDLRSYLYGQEELDITTEIRDALILSIPMKVLCRPDCLGLCPHCGANLNEQPCQCGLPLNTLSTPH